TQGGIPLLKPLEYVTVELSAEKYPTASKIIPVIRGIQNAINIIIPKTIAGLHLQNNILNNIEIRFDYIEQNNTTLIAILLDLLYANIKSCEVAFWNKHNYTMPQLFKIAEKYVNTSVFPATSVPSERIFSKAGQIMSERRNRLSAKNLDQLMFLNVNI
ncbi:uncharacterized protein LOC143220837, partial [Lasioglossum baleicum]|uniref:uncharacterized protein LOC143220837 n=1 Tax=Lasioglossum baleicum TaxID=434251 RepID=UPI003FCE9EB7